MQNVEFLAGQMHRLTAFCDHALHRIQTNLPRSRWAHLQSVPGLSPANGRADPGDQFPGAEGFGHIIVRSQVERRQLSPLPRRER